MDYTEYGDVIGDGRLLIEDSPTDCRFSVKFTEEYACLQPVWVVGQEHQIDHASPRLTIFILARTFVFGSLLDAREICLECEGAHVGHLQLETHFQSPFYMVKQAIARLSAHAQYCEPGLRFSLRGSLRPPAYLPKSLPEGGTLPSQWPTAFLAEVTIPWQAIPILLGNADYFSRVREHLYPQPVASEAD